MTRINVRKIRIGNFWPQVGAGVANQWQSNLSGRDVCGGPVQQQQIEELRNRLIEKQDELRDAIERDNEQLGEQLDRSQSGEAHLDFNHPADMVGADSDYEKELNLLRRERSELAEVGEALERIAEGSYGVCEECGEEISFARLKAVPQTTHCISCQETLDKKRH
jgi:DnaK suppressor protein